VISTIAITTHKMIFFAMSFKMPPSRLSLHAIGSP